MPLLPGTWNKLRLKFRGSDIQIELNGSLVYERTLELTNQRSFGLFHYKDRSEARVRNIVMQGDWPKTLQPMSEQELADHTQERLDADFPRLKAVFAHDFAKDGLPEKYFDSSAGSSIAATPLGVQMFQSTRKNPIVWDICARFGVSGDFDVETTFTQLKIENRTEHCGILLRTALDAPEKPVYDIHRNVSQIDQRIVQGSKWLSEPLLLVETSQKWK